MDLKYWHNRRVLVTGHTGFKGAWLSLWLERLGAQVTGIALPPPTNPSFFEVAGPWPRLQNITLDLRHRHRTITAFGGCGAEVLFHLAAQPIVSKAQRDPVATFETNVMGSVHVLEACLKMQSLRAAVVVTTDKVYDNRGDGRAFREGDALSGDEPYSASKAAVELAVSAYRPAFHHRRKSVATARAGNVIGGGDAALDRIIPDLVRSLGSGRPTRIRNPAGVRPWLHVLEPLAGYLALAERLASGAADVPITVNLGPTLESDRSVLELVDRFLAHFPKHPGFEVAPNRRIREAPLLRLDSTLAERELDWRPRLTFEAAVDWAAEWFQAHRDGADMRETSLAQIARYEALLPPAEPHGARRET